MKKRTISETIIDLESAALEAWHDGNPSPYLELYSKNFTAEYTNADINICIHNILINR
ncbi:hypothetical protein [Proteiniphilum sp. UBA5510]|uniref:hypothetical protein n=1 Tax=Proteiniphilum sp. UBA5510 TaxID=1947286 RepID=UPI0025798B60|nr:hypothetical protein [Proteiniphilum sp. UBA5510]